MVYFAARAFAFFCLLGFLKIVLQFGSVGSMAVAYLIYFGFTVGWNLIGSSIGAIAKEDRWEESIEVALLMPLAMVIFLSAPLADANGYCEHQRSAELRDARQTPEDIFKGRQRSDAFVSSDQEECLQDPWGYASTFELISLAIFGLYLLVMVGSAATDMGGGSKKLKSLGDLITYYDRFADLKMLIRIFIQAHGSAYALKVPFEQLFGNVSNRERHTEIEAIFAVDGFSLDDKDKAELTRVLKTQLRKEIENEYNKEMKPINPARNWSISENYVCLFMLAGQRLAVVAAILGLDPKTMRVLRKEFATLLKPLDRELMEIFNKANTESIEKNKAGQMSKLSKIEEKERCTTSNLDPLITFLYSLCLSTEAQHHDLGAEIISSLVSQRDKFPTTKACNDRFTELKDFRSLLKNVTP
ncbi:hypothetical protein OAL10_02700 [Gammaproteobacteria bacterium]|nr:hypothetical protein [Gammaproteobacteria bacterium]